MMFLPVAEPGKIKEDIFVPLWELKGRSCHSLLPAILFKLLQKKDHGNLTACINCKLPIRSSSLF